MGEILGIGLTHYPGLIAPDEDRAYPLTRMLRNPDVDPELKNPSNWPEPMRIEFGEDEGVASSRAHRARLVEGFRKQREELDKFNPDFVVIWGDDQYENFKEDIIPPSASWLTTISTAPPSGTGRPTPGENPLTKSSPIRAIQGLKLW